MKNPGQQIPLWHMLINLLLEILILKFSKNLHASFPSWQFLAFRLPSTKPSATPESPVTRINNSAYVRLIDPDSPSNDSFFYCSRKLPGRLLFSRRSDPCAIGRALLAAGTKGKKIVILCIQNRRSENREGGRADGKSRSKLSSTDVLKCRLFSRKEEFESFFQASF